MFIFKILEEFISRIIFIMILDQRMKKLFIFMVTPNGNKANFWVKSIYSEKDQSTLPDDERSISQNVGIQKTYYQSVIKNLPIIMEKLSQKDGIFFFKRLE